MIKGPAAKIMSYPASIQEAIQQFAAQTDHSDANR